MNEHHAFYFYYGQYITLSGLPGSPQTTLNCFYICPCLWIELDPELIELSYNTNNSHYINVPAQCCKPLSHY